jgi:hypothetical protein
VRRAGTRDDLRAARRRWQRERAQAAMMRDRWRIVVDGTFAFTLSVVRHP